MTDVFKAIAESTQEQFNSQYFLPSFITSALDVLKKVHLYYWTFKDYKIFQQANARNRDQGNPIVYGIVLHGLSDYNLCLKIALITKCAEDLLNQYKQVHEAYRKLTHTIYRKYPKYRKYKWEQLSQDYKPELSPSLYLTVKIQGMNLLVYLSRIFDCVTVLCTEVFKLSMDMTDTYLIANGDALAQQRGYIHMVANWNEYQARLSNNNSALLETISKTQALTDKILTKLNINKRSIDFIHFMQNSMGQAIRHIPRAVEVAEEVLDPFINVQGAIVPIELGFDQQQVAPTIPPATYPPWTGQGIRNVYPTEPQVLALLPSPTASKSKKNTVDEAYLL